MIESSRTRAFTAAIIVMLTICLFLYLIMGILASFVIAAFITYLISPIVIEIQCYGYRRWVGVAVIAFTFISVFTVFFVNVVPIFITEVCKFTSAASDYYISFSNYIDIIGSKIETVIPIVKRYDILSAAVEKIRYFMFSDVWHIPQYLMSIFSISSIIILIPMLVIFMLLSGNKSINETINFFPSKYIETMLSVIYEIDSILGRFIRGQLIEAAFVGVMSIVCLHLLGINFSLTIGIITGFMNMIPCLGPFVGLFLALIVGVIQFQTAAIAVKIIILYAVIQFLDNSFVQPFVIGHSVNLGLVLILFIMLAGGQIFGFLGVVFAVPVTAILKTVFIMLINKYKRTMAYNRNY